MSEELLSLVDKVEIKPGYRTDHSSVELSLRLTSFDKSKGFWKFNNQILKDIEYSQQVKKCLYLKPRRKYALSTYNF